MLMLYSEASPMQTSAAHDAEAPDAELQQELALVVIRCKRSEIALAGARADFKEELSRCTHSAKAQLR